MYVVTVIFKIESEFSEQFLNRVKQQAKDSINNESECHVFDVCVNPEQSDSVFLYEVYSDRSAFDTHLNSAHFLSFDQESRDWVASKHVNTFLKIQT
ncbi:MAG: autoinducer 2-degrading protein [Gammaproteobacteria bacterium]|jgi:autoinducer 2-degrading protein